jgi:hypothetical protein
VAHRDRSTRWEGRTSAATRLSKGVRDEACPQGPTTAEGPITTTPAHAIPGGQAAQESPIPGALRPHRPACDAVAGLAGSPSAWGQCRRRRGPESRRRAAGRGRLSPGARARPTGWELQAAAGAAGRYPHTGRTATTARDADRQGSGGATGVSDRDRAERCSQRPTPLVRLSPKASGHPSGAGRQRTTRLAWVRGSSRDRRRL